ncbi:MAG: hypothetical protein Q7S00_00595 [bacterium]|nr:hypothetical protein [bacterium]
MKFSAPTTDHLQRFYYELGTKGARSVGAKKKWPYPPLDRENLFCLGSDWSRWDPRLLQILVDFGSQKWSELKPQLLRHLSVSMLTPQTLGVVVSFIKSSDPKNEESILFWNYVTAGLKPVATQFYFRELYLPGSDLAERAAQESLEEFKQWGFLARERVIIDAATRQTVGNWDQASRLNILRRLFKNRGEIQISDYLEEIQESISRQQALLDLKALPADQKGKGRSASWVLKAA